MELSNKYHNYYCKPVFKKHEYTILVSTLLKLWTLRKGLKMTLCTITWFTPTHPHTNSTHSHKLHPLTDAAVFSGSLMWRSAKDDFGRAAVLFTLTLTLHTSHYPHINATSVGVANISLPGTFELGTGSDFLRVVAFFDDYFIATGEILHRYHDYADSFSLAEYEYCCRGDSLLNNEGTMYV